MPSSKLEAAPKVLNLVWEVAQRRTDTTRPFTVLDVGPGWGKYGVLVREYVDPAARIIAVEAWEPYTERLSPPIYDLVIVGDIRRQSAALLAEADVVLLVDVIEHLPKPDGFALLDRIPGWVVISTPRDYFENPAHLPHTEAHVSHWTLSDFAGLTRFDGHAPDELANLGALIVRLRPRP